SQNSHICNLLLRPGIFSFAINAMSSQMRMSMQDDTHHYMSQQFSDSTVVVSAVPSLILSQAMTYFPEGYIAIVDSLMREHQFDLENSSVFIHWILCQDRSTGEQGVHLSFFSSKPP